MWRRKDRDRRWRGAPLSLALALGLGARASMAAPPDCANLIRRSETADQRVDYAGTKVVRSIGGRRNGERVVKVWHRAPDQTRIEFIEGGPRGGTLIQQGDQHYWSGPDRRVRRFISDQIPGRLDLLLQNYRAKVLRKEAVAGHRALVVSVEPKHAGNPRKVTWIEPRSGLALKTQLFSSAGELTEESAFQEIDLKPTFAPGLFDVPSSAPTAPDPTPVRPDFTPRRPAYLPPGYLLVRTSSFAERDGRVVAYLRYTDGLNTLSLFQARAGVGEPPGRGRGARVSGTAGDVQFSIIGDFPAGELQKMADSIRR
jgi:negative regulator of sigma E activity